MKKLTAAMLVAIIFVMSFVLPVFAQNDEIKVFINGQEVEFDVEPQIIDSRTMIPIRAVFEKMGAIVDWDEETKTATCTKNDVVAKVTLGDKKIYQGDRIINWGPCCKTALSDAEVEYAEEGGHFWHLRYPFEDGSGYLELATTRPETLLGDTAVAVNPNDERYKDIVGKY